MRKAWKLSSPILTVVLFVVAGLLLLGSSIGGTRAALTYFSENYTSRVQMHDIGVTLNENGKAVSWRNYTSNSDGLWRENTGLLLSNMLPEGESLKLGTAYKEAISVTNSGTIDQYVRVSIYKYWLDKDGAKLQELSPSLIELNLINLGTYWILDESASTPERTVLYYNKVLSSGETSVPLSDTLTINGMVASKVTQTETKSGAYTTITTTYDYDGVRFQIEAEVNAVQTHNAEDAIWSAWGRRVSIDANSKGLSLK